MRIKLYSALLITLILVSGCSSFREPSDPDVLHLVKRFYLMYRGGEDVNAEIIERDKFSEECDCYPIRLKITSSDRRSFERVFFFYKNNRGDVDIREYKFGIKK